jgi:hypothetical protein
MAVEHAMLTACAKAGNVAGIRTSTDPEKHQPNVRTGKNFVSFHSLCQILSEKLGANVKFAAKAVKGNQRRKQT